MTGTPQLPQRLVRLAPLADVLAALGRVAAVAARDVPAQTAKGLVLAADAVLAGDLPKRAIALRDGYAVRSDWSLDASSYAPAALPSSPIRVDAGEAMPEAADAVALFDAVETDAGGARMTMTIAPGEGVLPAGADGAAGVTLLRAGARLSASHVSILMAAGHGTVSIRMPRICIARAKADESGMIAGAAALVARDGEAQGCTVQTVNSLAHALASQDTDAIIGIGGTGSGRGDAAVTTLTDTGKVLFHGIGISPGETAALGFAGSRPVLLLPGRLDAAIAAWLLVGRPMLARLAGATGDSPSAPAALTRKIASAIGLAEVVPVHCANGEAEPLATGYWPLQALARANGWVLVPAASEGWPAGTRVDVRPLP